MSGPANTAPTARRDFNCAGTFRPICAMGPGHCATACKLRESPDELRRAVKSMAAMLGNREWAEHVSSDPDAQALESAITELQGEHSEMHAALQTIADGLGPAAILAQQVLADLGSATGEQP